MKHLSRLLTFALVLGIASFAESTEQSASTVTLPIEVYKEYLQLKERPAVTTLDRIFLSGALANKKFTMTVRGQSSRKAVAKDFILIPDTMRLTNCKGNAMVYRTESGYSLLPKEASIQLSCELRFREQESFSLQFGIPVLDVRTNIAGAEAIEQPSHQGKIRLLIRRKIKPTVIRTKAGKVVALPRYRITVKSDEIRFSYSLRFDNPSPRNQKYVVPLKNGERVSQIQTNLPNEADDQSIQLTLRPGTSHATITGQLPKPSFFPLFDNEEQYLLLEFHPLVALKLSKSPPRIGIEQTGMRATYQAAMAFLIGKGKALTWKSKTRKVFASQSFTATKANYTVYIPRKGAPIVDASWQLRNQGKPSLRYQLPGKALFASTDGRPQVLAKTDENELFLPLRTGQTNLRVQYELKQTLPRTFGIWTADLVKPDTVIPTANSEIRIDTRHRLVAAKLLGEIKFPWFDANRSAWALLMAILWFFVLQHFGVRERKWTVGSALGLFILGSVCGIVSCYAFWVIALAYLVRYRKTIWAWILKWKKTTRPAYVITACVLAILLLGFLTLILQRQARYAVQLPKGGMYEMASEMEDMAMKEPSDTTTAFRKQKRGRMAAIRASEAPARKPSKLGLKKDETYLGLPVERDIPYGRMQLYLSERSVPEKARLSVRLLVIGYFTSLLLGLLVFAAWIAPLVKYRKTMAGILKG